MENDHLTITFTLDLIFISKKKREKKSQSRNFTQNIFVTSLDIREFFDEKKKKKKKEKLIANRCARATIIFLQDWATQPWTEIVLINRGLSRNLAISKQFDSRSRNSDHNSDQNGSPLSPGLRNLDTVPDVIWALIK